jgi:hypothetical protein
MMTKAESVGKKNFFQRPLVPFFVPATWPSIFPVILFLSTTLLTGMTGSSLHVQWPLTSQSHGSFLKENNCFVMYQTPHPRVEKTLLWESFTPTAKFCPIFAG